MFRRFALRNQCIKRSRSFAAEAAPPSFAATKKRFDDLTKSLPGLFDSAKIQKEQQALIDAHFKPANLDPKIKAWNTKVEELKSKGVRFHYGINVDMVTEGWASNQPTEFQGKILEKPAPLVSPDHDWQLMDKKFRAGQKIVDSLVFLKEFVDKPWDRKSQEQNNRLMEANEIIENLDVWRTKLEFEDDEYLGCGIPIPDEEVSEWAENYRKHSKFMGDPVWGSTTSIFQYWEKMDPAMVEPVKKHLKDRDDKFYNEFVVPRNPGVTRERWDRYNLRQGEMFNAFDQSHYQFLDITKDLFRMCIWQSDDRVEKVNKEMQRLVEFLDFSREKEQDIKRRAYEENSTLEFRAEAAMELEARDVLTFSKVLIEIRDKIDASTFDKGIRELLKEHLTTFMDADRAGNKRALAKAEVDEPAEKAKMIDDLGVHLPETHKATLADEYRARLAELDRNVKAFEAEPITLEAAVNEVLPRALWMTENDPRAAEIEKFKGQVIEYCKGKGTLDAVNKGFWALMPNNHSPQFYNGDNIGPKDHKNLNYFCQYYRSRECHPDLWDINGLLSTVDWMLMDKAFALEGRLRRTKLAHKVLNDEGFDPIVLNLVTDLIKMEQGVLIPEIALQFSDLTKKYKGELYGSIISAQELTDAQFKKIMDSLSKSNPGKKFFLNRKVDSSLMAGFVIKVGVQTLNFSLLSEVEDFKKAQKKSA